MGQKVNPHGLRVGVIKDYLVVLLDGGHTMPAVQTAFIKKRAHPFPNESRRPLFRPPALSGASGQSLLLRSDHSAASALARSACHASYRVLNSFWLIGSVRSFWYLYRWRARPYGAYSASSSFRRVALKPSPSTP